MKNDGGSAYPFEYEIRSPIDNSPERVPHTGMTMRQYYKAAALMGMCASGHYTTGDISEEKMAEWAGHCADAMIAEDQEGRDE
jgi:hypothetical protein